MVDGPVSNWSPFSSASMAEPGSGHEYLLTQCPVHRCEDFDPPFYTLSRYADVEAALRNTEVFSSEYGQGPRFTEPAGMLCDPPQHTHLRSLVQPAFTPPQVSRLRTLTEQTAEDLLTAVAGRQGFDLHDDFAFPLPVIIIAGMLGVPEQDLDRFKYWSDIQVSAMGANDPSQYADEQANFVTYLTNHITARTDALAANSPVPDDLLTLIAGARMADGSPISLADALSMVSQLLVGGNETTTSLISNMVWRLLEEPSFYETVRANPDLVPLAVEESLRFDPPVLGLYRNTTRSIVVHDTNIPQGVKVWLNYAAANRDPDVFSDPNTFRLDRDKQRHMSFGLGVHFCLGAAMARMEAEIALTALCTHFPNMSLINAGERIAPFFLWGRKKLPVRP